ncbi:MAG: GntR family transcriptional regulator [Limnochordales bacterium]|nr:GntR family transcriptional regulator [Limnochordales bacterium]
MGLTQSRRGAQTLPTLYERVKAHLRAAIAAGEYLPGDRLPPETELMQQFGVSRNTVTRALNDLVGEGLLLRIRGSGTYVRRRDTPASRRLDPSVPDRRPVAATGAGSPPLRLGVVADMAVPVGNPYVTAILAGMSRVLPVLGAQAVLLGAGWDKATAQAQAQARGAASAPRDEASAMAVPLVVARATSAATLPSPASDPASAPASELIPAPGPQEKALAEDELDDLAEAVAEARPELGLGPRGETVTLLNLAANVDGLVIIAPRRSHLASLRALERHRIPFVVVGTRLDLNWHPWHNVHVDNIGAAADVARHLLTLGHRRLLCLTGDWEMQDSADRAEGFRAACLAAGLVELPGRPLAADGTNTAMTAELATQLGEGPNATGCFRIVQLADERNWHLSVPEVVRRLMTTYPVQQRPTAIFAAGFSLALAARRALQELGLSVPGDVSLVGFDDSIAAAYLDPPLTTVEQPLADMGSLAARILVAALRGELPRPVQRSLAASLIIRSSTAGRQQG